MILQCIHCKFHRVTPIILSTWQFNNDKGSKWSAVLIQWLADLETIWKRKTSRVCKWSNQNCEDAAITTSCRHLIFWGLESTGEESSCALFIFICSLFIVDTKAPNNNRDNSQHRSNTYVTTNFHWTICTCFGVRKTCHDAPSPSVRTTTARKWQKEDPTMEYPSLYIN